MHNNSPLKAPDQVTVFLILRDFSVAGIRIIITDHQKTDRSLSVVDSERQRELPFRYCGIGLC